MQISQDSWIAPAMFLLPPSQLTLPWLGVFNIYWKPGGIYESPCSSISKEGFYHLLPAVGEGEGETTVRTWGPAGSSLEVMGSQDRRLAEEPYLPSGQLLLNPGRSFWTTVCPCKRERATKAWEWIHWELGLILQMQSLVQRKVQSHWLWAHPTHPLLVVNIIIPFYLSEHIFHFLHKKMDLFCS